MILVLMTSAGVPKPAATKPAQIDEAMWTMWSSGRPVVLRMYRFTESYVVRSPRLTKAARWTFGTLPFQRAVMPPRFTISLKAWDALCTRGFSPISRRFPSIWMWTLTRSAGEARNCAKPPAVTPATADRHSVSPPVSSANFLRKMS